MDREGAAENCDKAIVDLIYGFTDLQIYGFIYLFIYDLQTYFVY